MPQLTSDSSGDQCANADNIAFSLRIAVSLFTAKRLSRSTYAGCTPFASKLWYASYVTWKVILRSNLGTSSSRASSGTPPTRKAILRCNSGARPSASSVTPPTRKAILRCHVDACRSRASSCTHPTWKAILTILFPLGDSLPCVTLPTNLTIAPTTHINRHPDKWHTKIYTDSTFYSTHENHRRRSKSHAYAYSNYRLKLTWFSGSRNRNLQISSRCFRGYSPHAFSSAFRRRAFSSFERDEPGSRRTIS